MNSAIPTIRAGRAGEIKSDSRCAWVFVDIGFAGGKNKTCGLLICDGNGRVERRDTVTFEKLREELSNLAQKRGKPLNLVIEAPLSVAFNKSGNPAGRAFEKYGNKTRYWYAGLGCSVLMATTYLLRALYDADRSREIRLFEGFVSFKSKNQKNSHLEDVKRLRKLVFKQKRSSGDICVVKSDDDYELKSAFAVAGMDLGVPPVVVVAPKRSKR